MKIIYLVVVLFLIAKLSTEGYIFVSPHKEGGSYMPFMNGHDYHVGQQYYWKEISAIFVEFTYALCISLIIYKLSKRASVFFWLVAVYELSRVLIHAHNHSTVQWPFYLAFSLMIIFAVWIFCFVKEPGAKVIKM